MIFPTAFGVRPRMPWLLLPLLLIAVGCGNTTAPSLGQRLYQTYCQTCHQADGLGRPGVYPPLRGTEWVTGDEGRLIRLVLHGVQGPMTIGGVTYNNLMPPQRFLSDDQIAAVLTFVRAEYGGGASAITPEAVAAVRAASTQREPWLADTLYYRTGIPAVE